MAGMRQSRDRAAAACEDMSGRRRALVAGEPRGVKPAQQAARHAIGRRMLDIAELSRARAHARHARWPSAPTHRGGFPARNAALEISCRTPPRLCLLLGPAAAAEPVHGIAMHGAPEASAGLPALPLRQSRRAQGRPARAGHARHLRQPQSLHHQGRDPRQPARVRLREPDDAQRRRAVHALRPDRRKRRGARGPQLRHLPPAQPRRASPTARRSRPRTCSSATRS